MSLAVGSLYRYLSVIHISLYKKLNCLKTTINFDITYNITTSPIEYMSFIPDDDINIIILGVIKDDDDIIIIGVFVIGFSLVNTLNKVIICLTNNIMLWLSCKSTSCLLCQKIHVTWLTNFTGWLWLLLVSISIKVSNIMFLERFMSPHIKFIAICYE